MLVQISFHSAEGTLFPGFPVALCPIFGALAAHNFTALSAFGNVDVGRSNLINRAVIGQTGLNG